MPLAPAPLLAVTLALPDKDVANLPHVVSLISFYLDRSLDIPLHQACATGSLALLDRIWSHSQLPRGEGSRWCPAASLQTNRHYKRWQFSQSLIQAIRRRDLVLVDWIFAHFMHCVTDVEVVEEAASTGQLEVLDFLLDKDSGHTQEEYEVGNANGDGNGVTWGGEDMKLAAMNGHNDVVRWLLEHTSTTPWAQRGVLIRAVRAGNLSIAKLMVSRGVRVAQPHELVAMAAVEGHLELLQWLVEQNFLGRERKNRLSSRHLHVNLWLVESGLEWGADIAFGDACAGGRLPVVWWLADYMDTRGVDLGKRMGEYALASAAARGLLEVVKWLIERGFGTRSDSMVIRSAVESGHLEVAKYLHAQGFTGCNQETLRGAARGGHFAVVRWLWTQFHDDLKVELLCQDEFVTWMLPLTREMAAAATNGHLEVVQYLYAIALALVGKKRKRGGSCRYPCKLEMDDVVIVDAARNGHLNVVQWICTDTTVSSIKEAISYAAGSGHFPVVKWLHENRPHEDFQSVVMDEAARYGDLSLVKWLHTNRPDEGWSPFGIDNAARGGYLHILRWLRDHEVLYEDSDYSLSMNAMQLAFMGGHFDALLFVHYEFKNWSSNRIMLEDDGFHNAHMKAWLQEELEVLSDAN